MQPYKRHILFYKCARGLISPLLKGLFRFQWQKAPDIQGPAIIVANHTTDLDALFVALSFKKHMYFVASEHIFRGKTLGRLLVHFLDPIPKQKGGADIATAMQMMRRLKKGMNIGLFPEGSKSFHGKPCPVVPATGGLIRASGASLVTYRLEGGYFSSPRWARTFRKGRMKGYPVKVYSPGQLQEMTPEEINEAIALDIGEDAYQRQDLEHTAFHGKRLAEGLENALYLCPACEKIGTLTGKDNTFTCTCGMKAAMDQYGYLSGVSFPKVDAWGAWQREKLRDLLLKGKEDIVFTDWEQEIYIIHSLKEETLLKKGTITVTKAGLSVEDFFLPWENVMAMEVYGRNRVVFSDTAGNHYRLRSEHERSGLKYMEAYRIMNGQ